MTSKTGDELAEAGGTLAGDKILVVRGTDTIALDSSLVVTGTGTGWDGEAANYAALPAATNSQEVYLVLASSGVLWNRRKGLYQDTGTWNRLSNATFEVSDAESKIVDDADNTKEMVFQLDQISTGTTRTLTMADSDVNLTCIGLISGIISGFDVTVNGGDPAKIDIAAGVGFIIDWSTGSKVETPIVFAGLTAVTITDIASELFTSLYIDDTGSLQQVGGALLSNSTIRQNIVIDAVVHNDFATITNVAVNGVQAYQYGNALFDYVRKLGPINDGNGYSAGGADLSIHKSAGTTTFPWINRNTDPQNPDEKPNAVIAQLTATDWSAFYQDGSGGFTVEVGKTAVDPELWDDGSGILAAVANNRFTIKRFYFFGQNNQTVSTYGQAEYQSLVAAEAAIFTEAPVLSPLLATGTFVTALIVKKGVTNLTTAVAGGDAKFANITSQTSAAAGGAGAQDLQNTYDLSTDPEILTDSTRGALSIQQGSGADTDDIIEGKNGAGTQTSAITGAGDATFANILVSNTTPASQMLDTNASVDEGFWETTAVNNKLRHRTRDDTGGNGVIYHVVTRSGTTVLTQEFLQGRVLIDDTTEATTTTDGSLQTDGGLSAVKSILTGSLFKSLIATGRAAIFGDSSLADKYIQIRDGSAGLNLGLDSSENNVGIQAGTSKGFAVKVNSDTTTFGLASPDFDIDTSGDATFYNAVRDFNRIGIIEEYAGTSLPTFALFADGSAVSRTTYSDLFARISTVFGVGDGSTTFNLPDKRDRVAVGKNSSGTFNTLGGTGGSETHLHSVNPPSTASSSDGSHNHGGATAGDGASKNVQAGILGGVNTPGHAHTVSSDGDHTHTTDIAAFNSDNGSSLQPYIVLNYIIWY